MGQSSELKGFGSFQVLLKGLDWVGFSYSFLLRARALEIFFKIRDPKYAGGAEFGWNDLIVTFLKN